MSPAQQEALAYIQKLSLKAKDAKDQVFLTHLAAMVREQGSTGEPLQKSNSIVGKLNAISATSQAAGRDAFADLASMALKTQLQNDGSRFRTALGKTEWPGQREWESGAIDTRQQFDGSGAWYRPKPAGRTAGAPIYDDASENNRHPALPVSSTSEQHWTDGEKVMDAEALRLKAYAQILEILAGQRKASERLSAYNWA